MSCSKQKQRLPTEFWNFYSRLVRRATSDYISVVKRFFFGEVLHRKKSSIKERKKRGTKRRQKGAYMAQLAKHDAEKDLLQRDMINQEWATRDTCRFCDYRAKRKIKSITTENKGEFTHGKKRAVLTDRVVDQMCSCSDKSLSIGDYGYEEKSDSYSERFVAEDNVFDESIRFAREIFKFLLKEALHGDTFKTMSFARMRVAADTLAQFVSETQHQSMHKILLDGEVGFSRGVQFVLHKNMGPDEHHKPLLTPYAWFKAFDYCISFLHKSYTYLTSMYSKILSTEVTCDKSCSSPCKVRDGKCSYEKHPLVPNILSSASRASPWKTLNGCGLAALIRNMEEKKVARKDEDVIFEQDVLICEDNALRKKKASAGSSIEKSERKWEPSDGVDPSSPFLTDTCAFCAELRDSGAISTGDFYRFCSKDICGGKVYTHRSTMASFVMEPRINFARGIFMDFITSSLVTNPFFEGVQRTNLQVANFNAMRAAITRASPYMDEGDILEAHSLVKKAEEDTGRYVRMIMHTNKNGEERLLSPAAWCKAIMQFFGYFNKCETELIQIIRNSVTKERPTRKCKQNASGTCEAPCVAETQKLLGKLPGRSSVRCVYNKKLVDEMKENPGGLWSARGCGLHYI